MMVTITIATIVGTVVTAITGHAATGFVEAVTATTQEHASELESDDL